MQLVSNLGIPKEDAEALVCAVLDGGVSLLLGAGASYGAQGGDGLEIKGAVELAHDINETCKLGLDESERSKLSLVYGDAAQPSHRSRLNSFLQRRFTNCTPTWQSKLFSSSFRWKRIWTLNIDDVLAKAYPASNPKRFTPFSWTDQFKPRPLDGSELQIIHLHGIAQRLATSPDHLIFSIAEYAARNEALPGWHTEFRSEFAQKPFIVVGARLTDEYDLATVLEFGNRSKERGGCPSFVILRDIFPGQAARFSRQGLVSVKATGEAFFDALRFDVAAFLQANPEDSALRVQARSEMRACFRQLHEEMDQQLLNRRRVLDYYASVEAQWGHIVDDLDAPIEATRAAISWLSANNSTPVRFALISGDPVSGKTTMALRIGLECMKKGYEVWSFRGEELYNEALIVEYARTANKLLIIFDDAADYSQSFRFLSVEAMRLGVQLRVVVTCESNRARAVIADIHAGRYEHYTTEPIQRCDFDAIFEWRKKKGRLGSYTAVSTVDAWKQFRNDYNGRLLEWLESLENANDFRAAITDIFSKSAGQSDVFKKLLCATATVHRFGYSLPYFVADAFKGSESLDGLTVQPGPTGQLAYFDDRGIRLRSSVFSKFVWNKLSTTEKFNFSLSVAKRLAPLLTPLSVSRRTQPYLLLRALMDWETVRHDLREQAGSWYAALEPLCGWNARFWEQRALLASDKNDELRAFSYAKKAIDLHGRDAFPYTTLGKICMKIAVTRNDAVAVERFWEGVEALSTSRELAIQSGLEWEHPYITFFSYALRVSKLPQFQNEKAKLMQVWIEWMRDAKNSAVLNFLNDRSHRSLDDYQREWLLQAVK